jgi:hypothetical protein
VAGVEPAEAGTEVTRTFRLLSRPGCHLCEEMKARVEPLLRSRGDALAETDVDSDPALAERFGLEIPVLLDPDGRVVAKVRDGLDAIARRLAARS